MWPITAANASVWAVWATVTAAAVAAVASLVKSAVDAWASRRLDRDKTRRAYYLAVLQPLLDRLDRDVTLIDTFDVAAFNINVIVSDKSLVKEQSRQLYQLSTQLSCGLPTLTGAAAILRRNESVWALSRQYNAELEKLHSRIEVARRISEFEAGATDVGFRETDTADVAIDSMKAQMAHALQLAIEYRSQLEEKFLFE